MQVPPRPGPPTPPRGCRGTTRLGTITPRKTEGRQRPAAAARQTAFRSAVGLGFGLLKSRVIWEQMCIYFTKIPPNDRNTAFSYGEQRTKLSSKKPHMS